MGDAADGYPGLTGWGAKSSAAVLAKFVHLESIPADWREWGVNAANASALAHPRNARCCSERSQRSGPTSRCLKTWTSYSGKVLTRDSTAWGRGSSRRSAGAGSTRGVCRKIAPILDKTR